MLLKDFLQETRSSPLLMHDSGFDTLISLANNIYAGTFQHEKRSITIRSTSGESYNSESAKNPFDNWENGSIAILPLQGIMLKNGSWFYYGVDEIDYFLQLAYKSPKIGGVLFIGNTPGGTTNSVYRIEETLRNHSKPTWMLVDGMLCSCGMYVGSFCDKIYAVNPMCSVGSIGVMAQLAESTGSDNYKVVKVYPDESHLKNYPEREALNGNQEPLKTELSKLAVHFQNIVQTNRPQVTDKEALAGKTYLAREAIGVGLIDGIKSEKETIAELAAIAAVPDDVKTKITNILQ